MGALDKPPGGLDRAHIREAPPHCGSASIPPAKRSMGTLIVRAFRRNSFYSLSSSLSEVVKMQLDYGRDAQSEAGKNRGGRGDGGEKRKENWMREDAEKTGTEEGRGNWRKDGGREGPRKCTGDEKCWGCKGRGRFAWKCPNRRGTRGEKRGEGEGGCWEERGRGVDKRRRRRPDTPGGNGSGMDGGTSIRS